MSIPVWKEAHQEPGRLEGSSGTEISSVAQVQTSSGRSIILASVLSTYIYRHIYSEVLYFQQKYYSFHFHFVKTKEPPPHRLAGTFAESFLRLAELLTNWFIRRVLSCNSEVWEELFAFFTQVIKSVHWWSEMNRIVLLPSAQLIVYSVSQRNGRGRLPLQGLITLQRTWIKTKPG